MSVAQTPPTIFPPPFLGLLVIMAIRTIIHRSVVVTIVEVIIMASLAAATAKASALPKFRYLSAWFCPFAHRATLALEHHADRVE